VFDVADGSANAGDVFTFECVGEGKLTVTAERKGSVKTAAAAECKDVAFALFDTYLGASMAEVSPTLKASVKKTLGQ